MEKFKTLKGIAAPLDILNIDTDMIIPKQFLKTIKRSGLGKNLFDEMRFSPDGSEIKEFVLNNEPWKEANILIVILVCNIDRYATFIKIDIKLFVERRKCSLLTIHSIASSTIYTDRSFGFLVI